MTPDPTYTISPVAPVEVTVPPCFVGIIEAKREEAVVVGPFRFTVTIRPGGAMIIDIRKGRQTTRVVRR